MRRFTRVARKRPKYRWMGFQGDAVLSNTTTAFIISSSVQRKDADVPAAATLVATWIQLSLYNTGANAPAVGMYLNLFQTDLTETAPSSLIVDPLSTDVDLLQMPLLWMFRGHSVGVQPPLYLNQKVKAQRRLMGNEELNLVMRASSTSTIAVSYCFRTLFRF